ncbi:L,D-transpeptidase [Nakamurella leprariae]|uniref:L,D-transpeptidase n=1 Tax=Nakamurella leprariae TaxID=2803911 RepID=UPI002E288B37|nr:Ig-like domain-containing protein [Nakamurella leprariae]
MTDTVGQTDASAPSSGGSSSSSSSSTVAAPVAAVTASPAFGSSDLSPVDPITVSVAQGTITDFTLTNPAGEPVDGTLAADGTSWTVGEPLGFGKTYTATGSATGTDGKVVPISGSFTTVTPQTEVRTTVAPADGAVVGVAAPITVSFGQEPVDRALIQRNVTLTTTPAVEGSWGWLESNDGRMTLTFRPEEYWPENTQVHVDVKVYGLEFGPGAYGASDLTSDFTIGRNQVVKADVNSHQMVVEQDGVPVASYPASYGRGVVVENGVEKVDPNLITRSGVHVVNEFFETKLMSNPRYGYENLPEKWAVRISNNGEFIHANPNSVGAQGSSNVTHGCINLSTENAEAYYKSALWGDPVEITGTEIQLSPADGDIWVWGVSWAEWQTLSAL